MGGAMGGGGDHVDFRGGEFHGPVVAQGHFYQQAAVPTALSALPARPAGFTGRGEELERLLQAFDPSGQGGTETVVVAAVSGLGGIGKTALAVEAAHVACGRGWFPGGVLFLDLDGYGDDPVTGEQALEALLRALGVEPEHIPVRADERAALYRSVLAERGSVLVLADNASSAEQVRQLTPGDARHRLLVTSRSKLPQLGARLLALGELPPGEAVELLDRALRIADPGDGRVGAEGEAAAQVAARCGCLPLGLQIAAALLVLDREKPVSELADTLAALRHRLVHLDDGERSVRAAFDLSYRTLPADQARVFRLLALAPGAEVTSEAVTAMAGEDIPLNRSLDALARAHLVERGSGRGRWRLHDLVRVFGGDLVGQQEAEAARLRLLEFYHRWATAAEQRLEWFPGQPEPERFRDRAAAFEWLDAEREGAVAAVQWADEALCRDTAVALAERLASYLSRRRYYDDWLTVARTAREAAHHSGDRLAEAGAWESLGSGLRMAGRCEEAVVALDRACALFRAGGDAGREVSAMNKLGIALHVAGRVDEAIDVHRGDLMLFRAAGDRRGEAIAWINLGDSLAEAGLLDDAIHAQTRACELLQIVGDRHHEGYAWSFLGSALRRKGHGRRAIESYRKSLEFYAEFEDWYAQGTSLEELALAHDDAGEPSEARLCRLRAADSFAKADAPDRAAAARAAAGNLTP
ncbi:ATP-binding protein [Streptomyces sp. NPDC003635]